MRYLLGRYFEQCNREVARLAAGGIVAWRVTAIGSQKSQEALRQVQKSEADLANLKIRLEKWQQSHDMGDIPEQGKAEDCKSSRWR
ncbi:MAG: hypothetical protein WDM70_11675 [Nitrosomonadales bacterium]